MSTGGLTEASNGTSSGNGGEVTIRTIYFNGKKEQWENWKDKFFVKAAIRGYENILSGDDEVPNTHNEDGTKKTLTDEEKLLAGQNLKGYGELMLSMNTNTDDGKIAFAVVKSAKTKQVPGGNLRLAYLRLKEKFEPNTAPQLVTLTDKLHTLKLKPGQDPAAFITELEALKVRLSDMDYEVTDKTLILRILNSLTKDYEIEVKMLEHRMQQLKEANKELTITDVRTELSLRYERLTAQKPVQAKQVEYAFYMGSKFKGKCHWCGKIGHKSTECRLRISGKPKVNDHKESENNSNTKGNRKNLFCTFCKIKGHDVSECRKKKRQENQEKENVGNNFKEVACMTTEGKADPPTFGRCTQCQRWGPTFEYCTVCGEDTGMIYFPTTLNPSDDQFEDADEEFMEYHPTDEEGRQMTFNLPRAIKISRIPYATFKTLPGLIVPPDEDVCAEIPLEQFFRFIHSKTDVEHVLYYLNMNDYVEDRCLMMKEFNFRTIPEILHNLNNLNFNVRLYNEYKFPSAEEKHMKEFTTEELQGMVTWGTHLIQVYINEGRFVGNQKASTTDNVSTGKRTNEQCCAMTDRKKWNFHKKPSVGFCHSPGCRVRQAIDLDDPKFIWLGDSGTSCHLTNTDQGMVSWTPIYEEISMADGTPAYATKQGTMRFEVHQQNGKRSYVTLHDCKYIEGLPQNLFSITKALAKGWKLSNRGVHIVLTQRDSTIEFDTVSPTTTGCVMTVHMVPLVPKPETSNSMVTRKKSEQSKISPTEILSTPPRHLGILGKQIVNDMARKIKTPQPPVKPVKPVQKSVTHPTATWELVVRDKNKQFKPSKPNSTTLDINYYHQVLGHVNEKFLRETARHYGIQLTGTLDSCVACSLAKIHHAPISNATHVRSTVPGERIFIDISYFPQPSIAGNKYWLLIVDDATDMAWSVFIKNKSDLSERMINFIYNMRSNGTPVKIIRLDNSGENNYFKSQTDKLYLGIKFEFTAPYTPEQNGRVERKFAILYE